MYDHETQCLEKGDSQLKKAKREVEAMKKGTEILEKNDLEVDTPGTSASPPVGPSVSGINLKQNKGHRSSERIDSNLFLYREYMNQRRQLMNEMQHAAKVSVRTVPPAEKRRGTPTLERTLAGSHSPRSAAPSEGLGTDAHAALAAAQYQTPVTQNPTSNYCKGTVLKSADEVSVRSVKPVEKREETSILEWALTEIPRHSSAAPSKGLGTDVDAIAATATVQYQMPVPQDSIFNYWDTIGNDTLLNPAAGSVPAIKMRQETSTLERTLTRSPSPRSAAHFGTEADAIIATATAQHQMSISEFYDSKYWAKMCKDILKSLARRSLRHVPPLTTRQVSGGLVRTPSPRSAESFEGLETDANAITATAADQHQMPVPQTSTSNYGNSIRKDIVLKPTAKESVRAFVKKRQVTSTLVRVPTKSPSPRSAVPFEGLQTDADATAATAADQHQMLVPQTSTSNYGDSIRKDIVLKPTAKESVRAFVKKRQVTSTLVRVPTKSPSPRSAVLFEGLQTDADAIAATAADQHQMLVPQTSTSNYGDSIRKDIVLKPTAKESVRAFVKKRQITSTLVRVPTKSPSPRSAVPFEGLETDADAIAATAADQHQMPVPQNFTSNYWDSMGKHIVLKPTARRPFVKKRQATSTLVRIPTKSPSPRSAAPFEGLETDADAITTTTADQHQMPVPQNSTSNYWDSIGKDIVFKPVRPVTSTWVSILNKSRSPRSAVPLEGLETDVDAITRTAAAQHEMPDPQNSTFNYSDMIGKHLVLKPAAEGSERILRPVKKRKLTSTLVRPLTKSPNPRSAVPFLGLETDADAITATAAARHQMPVPQNFTFNYSDMIGKHLVLKPASDGSERLLRPVKKRNVTSTLVRPLIKSPSPRSAVPYVGLDTDAAAITATAAARHQMPVRQNSTFNYSDMIGKHLLLKPAAEGSERPLRPLKKRKVTSTLVRPLTKSPSPRSAVPFLGLETDADSITATAAARHQMRVRQSSTSNYWDTIGKDIVLKPAAAGSARPARPVEMLQGTSTLERTVTRSPSPRSAISFGGLFETDADAFTAFAAVQPQMPEMEFERHPGMDIIDMIGIGWERGPENEGSSSAIEQMAPVPVQNEQADQEVPTTVAKVQAAGISTVARKGLTRDDPDRPKAYCFCKEKPIQDDMIACGNKNCPIEWFHFSCLGIKYVPYKIWYCNPCKYKMKMEAKGCWKNKEH